MFVKSESVTLTLCGGESSFPGGHSVNESATVVHGAIAKRNVALKRPTYGYQRSIYLEDAVVELGTWSLHHSWSIPI